jgi:hypothetical protein
MGNIITLIVIFYYTSPKQVTFLAEKGLYKDIVQIYKIFNKENSFFIKNTIFGRYCKC